MNILETFYVLFVADTTNAKKGQDEVRRGNDEVERGINRSDKAAKSLGESFLGVGKAIAAASAAYFTFSAIQDGMHTAVDTNTALDKQSKLLGINSHELAAYSGAVVQAGGKTGDLAGTLDSMYKNFSKFGLGDSSANFLDMLTRLNRWAQNKPNWQTGDFLRGAGIDEGTILLIQQSTEAFDANIARQRELNLVTNADTDIARKATIEWGNLGEAFNSLWTKMDSQILKDFPKVARGVENAVLDIAKAIDTGSFKMEEHKGIIIGLSAALVAIAGVVGAAAAPVIALGAAWAAVGAAIGYVAVNYDKIKEFLGLDGKEHPYKDPWGGLDADKRDTPWHAIRDVLGRIQDFPRKLMAENDLANQHIGPATESLLNGQPGSQFVNSNSIMNNGGSKAINMHIPITVNGAGGDSQSTADAISAKLKDMLQSTFYSLGSDGRAF